jgi:hypothetical protein
MAQTKLNVGYLKTQGAVAGDILRVGSTGNVEYSSYNNVAINSISQLITGTNANTYALTNSSATNTSVMVMIEGITQIPTVDYFVSGQNIVFTSSVEANANIEIRYFTGLNSIVTNVISRSLSYGFTRMFS